MNIEERKKLISKLLFLPIVIPIFIMIIFALFKNYDELNMFKYLFIMAFGSLLFGSIPYFFLMIYSYFKIKKMTEEQQINRYVKTLPLHFLIFLILPFTFMQFSDVFSKNDMMMAIQQGLMTIFYLSMITLSVSYLYIIIFILIIKYKERKSNDHISRKN